MELKIQTRAVLGKKVKSLRKEGFVPAEIFGRDFSNLHVSVNQKDFLKIYNKAGEHTVINLITETKNKIPVLVTEVNHHPLKNEILSIDFHKIKMDEKIQAKIPINFLGEAPALKNGFFIVEVLDELEIEALPDKIPHGVDANLTILEHPGQSIRANDLKIPAGVKILTSGETVVATVTKPAEEEIAAPPPTDETEIQTETKSPQETGTSQGKNQEKAPH